MRAMWMLMAVAVLALLPCAVAIDPVTVHAPDVSFHAQARSVSVDSSQYVDSGPALAGAVRTRDTTVDVRGPTCTIDPGARPGATACGNAAVQAPAPGDATGLVDAKLDLRLAAASASQAVAAGAARVETAAVAAFAQSPTVLLAAAAAGLSLVALYAAWRALKWTGLFALVPLYSHITDDEILDDPNRAAIYRLIQREAGISTKDVAEQLHLAWGTVTHHLGKLEKRRFVVSKKYGKYRRYFANGEGGTERKDQVAVLRLDRTGDVAALIRASPGLTQKAVSAALGVSSSTILWHVKRLESAGLITKVRDGKLVRYYPGEALPPVLVTPPAMPTLPA
jgi:DNA-binding transcriptional ArsR family regulator